MIGARTVELLREERGKLLKAVEHIDALLAFDGAAPAGDERDRHDVPTGRPVGRGAKYNWEAGRGMYGAGAPYAKIADALGCSVSAVKQAKKRYSWRRQQKKKPPARSQNGPAVIKCPNCGHETGTDPCGTCHSVLPKQYANQLAQLLVDKGARPA